MMKKKEYLNSMGLRHSSVSRKSITKLVGLKSVTVEAERIPRCPLRGLKDVVCKRNPNPDDTVTLHQINFRDLRIDALGLLYERVRDFFSLLFLIS